MTKKLLTGNRAAAWGARLADVDYVPAFPITPQTEIIETIAKWIDHGKMAGRMTMLESEHSMITAAGAAATAGARVFTATSSQGLMYGMEMLYTVAGWRVPLVLVNVSRGLSAPITLEPDHNDVLGARDSGFLQLHCSTCQEVLDSILFAYRIAEAPEVRMPVLVNLDGFYLSFTREPVDLPTPEQCRAFLPPFDTEAVNIRAHEPHAHGVAVLGGPAYSYFRYEAHLASLSALKIFDGIAEDFERQLGRRYQVVDTYRMQDAELALVMIGSFSTKALEAVDRLRDEGWPIGVVRPRLLRPFPEEAIRQSLRDTRAVAVIDQNISVGKGGVLHTELASALYPLGSAAPVLLGFVGGLGGRDIPLEELFEIAKETRAAAERGVAPPPRLLYTEGELKSTRKLQMLAQAIEQQQGGST